MFVESVIKVLKSHTLGMRQFYFINFGGVGCQNKTLNNHFMLVTVSNPFGEITSLMIAKHSWIGFIILEGHGRIQTKLLEMGFPFFSTKLHIYAN